jgi:hypothetical protein
MLLLHFFDLLGVLLTANRKRSPEGVVRHSTRLFVFIVSEGVPYRLPSLKVGSGRLVWVLVLGARA